MVLQNLVRYIGKMMNKRKKIKVIFRPVRNNDSDIRIERAYNRLFTIALDNIKYKKNES